MMAQNQSKFSSLLKNFNVNLIIFIENDFTSIQEMERIICLILLYLNDDSIELLFKDLSVCEKTSLDLLNSIITFRNQFSLLEYDTNKKNRVLESGNINKFLQSIRQTYSDQTFVSSLIESFRQIQDQIEKIKVNVGNETFYNITFKYGAVRIPPQYVVFFNEIKSFDRSVSFRVFKDASFTEWDNINDEVLKNLRDNECCLFIVDKMINGDDVEGEIFIRGNLFPLIQSRNLNILSILYTSNQRISNPIHSQDYFSIEVSKNDANAIGKITDSLAMCAYVNLFEEYKKVYNKSIETAFEIAYKSRSNMIYLTNMAHEEGITALEAVNKWFELVKNHEINKNLLASPNKTFQKMNGLTHFLSEEFLSSDDEILDQSFHDILLKINANEIYDFSINDQFAPTAPGDIFEFENKYYVLVGQECDFVVRQENSARNSKIADLLEANLINKITEKIDVQYKNVIVNYFNEINALDINLNIVLNGDFNVLDLCTFNSNGECKIHLNTHLNNQIIRSIPKSWHQYYKSLQIFFQNIIKVKDLLDKGQISSSVLSLNDISSFNYLDYSDDTIVFPLKRICRLKGDFKNSVIKAYWNYRSRTALNTIHNSKIENLTLKEIEIGYPGQLKTEEFLFEVIFERKNKREKNRYIHKLPMYINLDYFKKMYNLPFKESEIKIENIPYIEEESKIKIEKFYKEKNLLVGIRIIRPYINTIMGKEVYNSKIKLTDVVEKEILRNYPNNKELYIEYCDNQESCKLIDDTNGKFIELDIINDLSRGIILREFNFKINLIEDKIIRTSI